MNALAPIPSTPESIANRPKVLMVDDEANILQACFRVFRKEDFEFVTTTSAKEALAWVEEEAFALIISDHRMPEMEGTKLLEQIKTLRPESVRILLTGYADMKTVVSAINQGSIYRFLSKPWNDEELRQAVREGLRHWRLWEENQRLQRLTAEQNLALQEWNAKLETKVVQRTAEVAELAEDLRKSLLGTVKVLAGITEITNSAVGNHARRVATLSKNVARRLGLAGEGLFQMEVAALLHDLGRLNISNEILNKPEHLLKSSEKAVIQRHPLQGELLVRMIPNFSMASRIIRHQREHFDGSGFPDHLKGEKIPLGARVLFACNLYDNLLHSRRQFMNTTPEKILPFLERLADKELDPAVFGALSEEIKAVGKGLDPDMMEIPVGELREGMTLAAPLLNTKGVLLLPKGTCMAHENLLKMNQFAEWGQTQETAVIFRRPTAPEGEDKSPQNP